MTGPAVSAQQAAAPFKAEAGFTPMFDGKTLTGWQIINQRGEGYAVKDGMIYCAKGGGGKLLTDKEYGDFVLRFEFKHAARRLEQRPRHPRAARRRRRLRGHRAADSRREGRARRQVGPLRDAQYHGSVYDVVAAKKGAMKPAGEWNQQEVTAKGRQITVKLNGQVITDVNLDTVKDPEVLKKHPGLARTSGHIGFLGHNDYIEFRHIRIKPL